MRVPPLNSPTRRAVTLAALSSLLAAPAAAQTAVVGVVVDSLAGQPLAGATVQLLEPDASGGGRVRAADTDSAGAFRIEGVPAGRYLIGFVHERLDELGLEQSARTLVVTGREPAVRADLAVPGPRTFARAVCGPLADSTGALVGRVLDADTGAGASGGAVTVAWSELRVGGGAGVRLERRALRADVSAQGRFAACGVPWDVSVTVQARAGVGESGELTLRMPSSPLLRRDLLVTAARNGTAGVRGRVVRADGSPVPRAHVGLRGDDRTTLTDDRGAFALDSLPPGTRMLEARAIGLSPGAVAVDLAAGRAAEARVVLDRAPATLGAVTVFGKAGPRGDLAAFAERARSGFGRFITAEQIDRTPARAATDLLRTVPGVRVVPAEDGVHQRLLTRGMLNLFDQCTPDVFLDGTHLGHDAEALDDLVPPSRIAGIEVYVDFASAPVEYQRGPCGSVVVWTRRGRP